MAKKNLQSFHTVFVIVRKHLLTTVFLFAFIILLELLIIVLQYRQSLIRDVEATELPHSLQNPSLSHYPYFISNYEPYITAESAMILDNESKKILYEKRGDLRFSMASTTKLMTALVALDYYEYNDILTVKKLFREGSVIGFPQGEQIYFDDLLYALLLQSGNDAAYILADNYPGGYDAFVQKMNEKTRELQLIHTNFADPAGLNDDRNYTTTFDLAKLASYAITNPTLARVVNTKQKSFYDVSGSRVYEVSNLNQLLGTNGVFGIKTGTTRGAGEVLTTAVEKNGRDYILVVMKSEDRFSDTLNLISLLDGNIATYSPMDLHRMIQENQAE